jgi:alpha-beta hydrolase superfamily lysophospholipase
MTSSKAPTGSSLESKYIRDHSGNFEIRYAHTSNIKQQKNIIVFINGRAEWIEKYPDLHSWLLNGLDDTGFLTWDHRGQGASGGQRSYVEHYAAYTLDAARVIHEAIGDRPYTLLAHSMGALVSLYGIMTGHLKPESLIMCSPLLRMPAKPFPTWFAKPAAGLISNLGFGQNKTGAGKHDRASFHRNRLTHDPEVFRRIKNTPYPCASATFEWVYRTFQATEYCHAKSNLKKFKTPTLILTGTDERVTAPEGITAWTESLINYTQTPFDIHRINGGRHELFSEIADYRQPAIDLIQKWIAKYS